MEDHQLISDPSHYSSTHTTNEHGEEEEPSNSSAELLPSPQLLQHLGDYISTLRPTTGISLNNALCLHRDCYIPKSFLLPALLIPHLFRPKPSHALIAAPPKCGNTWLKALLFTTFHRHAIPYSHPDHPLTRHSPHELVPFLEFNLYVTADHHLDSIPSHHELFATHLPFHLLPAEEHLCCPIIYLCREPKDSFVSRWHFVNRMRAKFGQDPLPLEEAFEAFCNGVMNMGPYWDSILGYWKQTRGDQKKPVLFLKYEELMEDTAGVLRRVAEFVGKPFTEEEEKEGVVEGIVGACEFGRLSGLEVNKSGVMKTAIGGTTLDNAAYFRKGRVGDWVNHISPEMGRRLDEITESKFKGTGLSFNNS